MPRGGKRPGAGRPKKQMTPLEYLLGVINNSKANAERRDKIAQVLLPYVHPKVYSGAGAAGKKENQDEKAKSASKGRFKARPTPDLKVIGKK